MASSLCTPAIGWAPIAVRRRVVVAPNVGGYATALPFAGHRSTDLPGHPPRAAPV